MASISNTINLRKTSEFPFYSDNQVIPHIYGVCRITPIPYLNKPNFYIIADHAIAGIKNVWVDNKRYKNFFLHNTSDILGKPISLLELDKPADNVVVEIDGKQDTSNGQIIQNPIDVIQDILKVAGISITPSRFVNLKSLTNDIIIHYVLDDNQSTIRSIISNIAKSCGFAFSLGLQDIGSLYPTSNLTATKTLTSNRIQNLQATIEAGEIYNRIVFEYNQDYATNKPQDTITLKTGAGDKTLTYSAPEITSNASAVSIATRVLEYYSRYRWNINFDTDDIASVPTDTIEIQHPKLSRTKSFQAFVKNAQTDLISRMNRITAEIVLNETPVIVLAGQSKLYVAEESAISYSYENGVLSIIVKDESGKPIKNAEVIILGKTSKCDSSGIAKFTLESGTYTVKIQASGYTTRTEEITF